MLVLFAANLLPSVVDFCFKHIIEQVADAGRAKLLLYVVPGAAYACVLAVQGCFFAALGSRVGLLLGSGCVAGACFLFWPPQRQEGDAVG